MQEADRTPEQDCCGKLFFAEPAPDRPGTLWLECCACGRKWQRDPDGTLFLRSDDQPPSTTTAPE